MHLQIVLLAQQVQWLYAQLWRGEYELRFVVLLVYFLKSRALNTAQRTIYKVYWSNITTVLDVIHVMVYWRLFV